MKSLTFKREKLYDEVWTKPMTELAKEYGINVYQLTEAYDKLEISRPETGYWSKLRHAKKVKKKSLTDSERKEYRLSLDTIRPLDLDKLLPKGYRPIETTQIRLPGCFGQYCCESDLFAPNYPHNSSKSKARFCKISLVSNRNFQIAGSKMADISYMRSTDLISA